GLVKLIDAADESEFMPKLRRGLLGFAGGVGLVTLIVLILWLGPYREAYADVLSPVVFSGLLAILAAPVIWWLRRDPASLPRQGVLIALIVFDLFTVGWSSLDVEAVPAAERLARPALVDVVLAGEALPPQRVDGERGLLANYGTLWNVPDIRGISPLWLRGPHALIQEDFPVELAWELFAVKYVFSDWEQLTVSGTVVAQGVDAYGPVNLHELADPRPFALLLDDVGLVDSDEFAYAVLADPGFDPRHSVVLLDEGDLSLPDGMSATGTATVIDFTPERIVIVVADNPAPAVLSIALPDYPGWWATVDGVETPVLRAYGGLSAVVLPGGAVQVELIFQSFVFTLGALISLAGWGALAGFAVWSVRRARRAQRHLASECAI
ncbi:MAG: hypothetical protein JW910_21655, partial [Anaerolineae bacterium]|nr:hypothetical protein [Anaerolineae bacterium]